jgi:hypothetical protein
MGEPSLGDSPQGERTARDSQGAQPVGENPGGGESTGGEARVEQFLEG